MMDAKPFCRITTPLRYTSDQPQKHLRSNISSLQIVWYVFLDYFNRNEVKRTVYIILAKQQFSSLKLKNLFFTKCKWSQLFRLGTLAKQLYPLISQNSLLTRVLILIHLKDQSVGFQNNISAFTRYIFDLFLIIVPHFLSFLVFFYLYHLLLSFSLPPYIGSSSYFFFWKSKRS